LGNRASSKKRSSRSLKRSPSRATAKHQTSTQTETPGESGAIHPLDPCEHLARITEPLLEVFSVVHDVYTESDAFDPDKLKTGYGRIYRAWKKAIVAMDPDFPLDRYRTTGRSDD